MLLNSSLPMFVQGLFALIFLTLSFLVYKCIIKPNYTSPMRFIPGPPNASLLRGNLPEIFKEGPSVPQKRWASQFGGFFKYRGFLGDDRLYISDPKALNHILLQNSYQYPKPSQTRGQLERILGRGILFAEGDDHRKQKRILSPAFSQGSVAALAPGFLAKTRLLQDIWTNQLTAKDDQTATINVVSWLSRLTLDIIGKTGFDVEFDTLQDSTNPLAEAFQETFGKPFTAGFFKQILFLLFTLFPVLQKLPTQRAREMKKSMNAMRTESRRIVKKKQDELSDKSIDHTDLISLLVKSNSDSENEKFRLTEEEISGQITTFMLAGHETTAVASSWSLFHLARNVSTQDRLRQEIRHAKSQGELTGESIANLPYLDAVVKEALRLQPPVPSTVREAGQDDHIPLSKPLILKNGKEVNSIFIKKHTPLFLGITVVNHSKDIWGEDAEEFNPERWFKLDPKVNDLTKGYTIWSHLFTFLGGPRACIGFRFSVLELKCILALLIDQFEFKEPEGQSIIGRSALVTRPFLENDIKAGSQLPLIIKLAS